MANWNQLSTVLNAVSAQALGETAPAVVSTVDMVSLGNAVLSSSANVDAWVGALLDRIGRTITSMRAYDAPNGDPLVKKPFEFGAILQKIYVDIIDAQDDVSRKIGTSGYTPNFAPIYKPDVKQKLFNKLNAWEFPLTIPDNLVKTAFVSAENMQAFIDSCFLALDNSLALSLENANNLVRATAIGSVLNGAGQNAINLLAEYNAIASTATTIDGCLYDDGFLRYSAQRILNVSRYMRNMSRIWNAEDFARHTPPEMQIVTLLSKFASSENVYLRSDVFHDEMLALPRFNEVPYWQGSGTSYDFDDISKINVTIPTASASTTVNQSGILGVIHDVETMGTTIDQRRTVSQRNDLGEYTDYVSRANIGYFFDPSENIAVFYVAENEN